MLRKIIKINEELCTGCGLCAEACHEGAIEMIDGKAKLVHEHYCDGLGDCLPSCPADAISFEEREAPAYDAAAVKAAQEEKKKQNSTLTRYLRVKHGKKHLPQHRYSRGAGAFFLSGTALSVACPDQTGTGAGAVL